MSKKITTKPIHIHDILSGIKSSYLKELERRQVLYKENSEKIITGIPTHFSDLDTLINGFGKSNLILLGSRPAMGKTSLALNIAENICFKNNSSVAIFSLEMTAEQLLHRIICSQSKVESNRIINGSVDPLDYQKIVLSIQRIEKHNIFIEDDPKLTITDLYTRAHYLKKTNNIQFLLIDYIQLLNGSKCLNDYENKYAEMAEISCILKALAKELNIPILCLSQLSRKVEERMGHRPMMIDLRESGSLEEDADLVMFLFRRDYYDARDRPGIAELIVAKNRHGNIGTVHLSFRKEIAQFGNYSGTQNNQVAYNSSHNEFMKS